MAEQLDPKNVDKRTWQRKVTAGLLDEKAYEKHVKSLPDAAAKGAAVDTAMFESDDDGDTDEAAEA